MDFMDYLKLVEGIGGEKDGRYYPYKVNGEWHIGHGHKIVAGEDFLDGLSYKEVEALLRKDTAKHANRAKAYVTDRVWNKLDTKQKEMLTDYEFNGGLHEFPKFTNAVISKDWDKAKQEGIRHLTTESGEKLPLGRNKHFYGRYLK